MFPPTFNILLVVETFLAFALAVSIHEAAHAGMAALLGDAAPVGVGRLSLAPRRQMAAIGTIVGIVFSVSLVPGGLGWGRPVDVDARRLRVGPNFGLILVALTGPLANLLIGVLILFGLTLIPGYTSLDPALIHCQGQPVGQALQTCLSVHSQSVPLLRFNQLAYTFAVTNIILALINVIPLHPLDGYRIVFALLPAPQAISFRRLEPYMELGLLVLFFVLPILFGFLRIPFNLGQNFIGWAQQIAASIAPSIGQFYLLL